jgi:O-Antigen ligase
MTVEYVGIVALLIGVLSLYCQQSFIVYMFFCVTLLGAAAAFVLTSLGGTNISPAHLLLCFLALRLLRTPEIMQNSIRGLEFGRPGFWFLLTVIYSTFAAYLMPRIFAGQTLIFAVRAQTSFSIPLSPAMSNLTQSIYFIGDLVCFVVIYGFASTQSGHRVLGKAAITCATVNLVFAALDIVTYLTNTADLFAPIRNATYSMLNDSDIAGFKRIVGSFTEASAFGAMTLGYFAFTGKLWLLGVYPRISGLLAFLSLAALVFSTSTTAYVGLSALLLFCYLETLVQALSGPVTRNMTIFLVGAPFIVLVCIIAIALNDSYSSYIMGLLNTMVLNKMSTDSGVERSSWNRQAMQNFIDTFGFGVGNGSVRASSILFGVPASLGVVGTLFFGLFFATLFLGRPKGLQFDRVDDGFRQAAKYTCLAWFIAGATSGAVIDLGLPFFAFAALACAKPARMPVAEQLPRFQNVG